MTETRVERAVDEDSDPGSAPATVGRRVIVDEASLERELIRIYADLLRLATLLMGSRSDGEEVVQIALERAWRQRRALRDPDRVDAWLRRIVAREASRLRGGLRARLRRGPVTVLDLTIPAPPSITPELAVDLGRAFDRLPASQRIAVVLHHYAGYSVDDAAALLGVPRETVRSRLRLGMARLRRELET